MGVWVSESVERTRVPLTDPGGSTHLATPVGPQREDDELRGEQFGLLRQAIVSCGQRV